MQCQKSPKHSLPNCVRTAESSVVQIVLNVDRYHVYVHIVTVSYCRSTRICQPESFIWSIA